MYKCSNCGEVFEEAKEIREDRGEFWGAPAYETVSVCPWCKSGDIYRVKNISWEATIDVWVDGTLVDFYDLSTSAQNEISERIIRDSEMSGEFEEEVY